MQLCAITDRRSLGNSQRLDEAALRHQLLALTEGWSASGVSFIQLREKDLDPAELQFLAAEMMAQIDGRIDGHRSRLLVNIPSAGEASLAMAARADGVHLAGKLVPGATGSVRQAFRANGSGTIVSVPCHSLEDIELARQEGVDMILFSPVFEKLSAPPGIPKPQGLEALRLACAAAQGIPVFALGGVTAANASACMAAGAAGVAGIRLFTTQDWRSL